MVSCSLLKKVIASYYFQSSFNQATIKFILSSLFRRVAPPSPSGGRLICRCGVMAAHRPSKAGAPVRCRSAAPVSSVGHAHVCVGGVATICNLCGRHSRVHTTSRKGAGRCRLIRRAAAYTRGPEGNHGAATGKALEALRVKPHPRSIGRSWRAQGRQTPR